MLNVMCDRCNGTNPHKVKFAVRHDDQTLEAVELDLCDPCHNLFHRVFIGISPGGSAGEVVRRFLEAKP